MADASGDGCAVVVRPRWFSLMVGFIAECAKARHGSFEQRGTKVMGCDGKGVTIGFVLGIGWAEGWVGHICGDDCD
ncbi:bioY protein [Sesbania bispinosa]|nr:bioY protein [Sesbania bispinosa]